MKKLKVFISIMISLILICACVINASAETIYTIDGFSYSILTNSTISICGWDDSSMDFVVPDAILNRNVVSIKKNALKDDHTITSIDFSNANHLQTIGFQSFYNCDAVNNDLILPSSITGLSISSFEGCSSIPSLTIEGPINTIPIQCFYRCSALSSISLPDSVTTIEKFAFAECMSLEYVALSENVTSIALSAFRNDQNLTLGVCYGSYPYQYAKDNNIPYIFLDDITLGDVNSDGYVNINDVTVIQRHLVELESLNELQELAADANRDGVLDISDATTLQMFFAEYEISYPIGELITQ